MTGANVTPEMLDDVSRLVDLDRAFTDAALTLAQRVADGTHSRFDATAVTATHDALDASLMAFRAAHCPHALRVAVAAPHVIVTTDAGPHVLGGDA